jgi:hypothetical protein
MKKEFLFDKNNVTIGMGNIKNREIYVSCNSVDSDDPKSSASLYTTIKFNSDIFSEEEQTALNSIIDKCYNEILKIKTS